MSEKQSALNTQVEGDHYKKLKMQPLELAYRVNGSPCFTKLAKYASRRKVDRLGDLLKAIHCIQLEKELVEKYKNPYQDLRMSDTDFTNILSEFTTDNFLWLALDEMYYGNYDDAVSTVKLIIRKEFPDEA